MPNALFQSIKSTVKRINEDLVSANGTGIYFAPELYISFSIGRNIIGNKKEIFGTDQVEWLREVSLSPIGPTDLVFEYSGKRTVIEIKLIDTYHKYISDIKKLKSTPADERYFCVLMDVLDPKTDERESKIAAEFGNQLKCVGEHSFPTWSHRTQGQIHCKLILYQLT